MSDENRPLSVAAAAQRAGVHPKTLLRALHKKELVGYQRGANATWRIYQADVDAWIRGEKPQRVRRTPPPREPKPRQVVVPDRSPRVLSVEELITAVARLPLVDLARLRDVVATAIAVREGE